jgi:hypothetical protein
MTLILCHGTGEDIEEFDLSRARDGCAFGRGFYFSNDISLGRQYSGGRDPIVARIVMDNAYIVDLDVPFEESLARKRVFRPNLGARERLIAAGYDGVLVKQGTYREVVAFHPSQIEVIGRRPDLAEPDDPEQGIDKQVDAPVPFR